jgi:hypothetical protein
MAFSQVGRGCLKLQLPGGQICVVMWRTNSGGFNSASSRAALEQRYTPRSKRQSTGKRKSVAMIFLLCPICFGNRCRILFRPKDSIWGCRQCHAIQYIRSNLETSIKKPFTPPPHKGVSLFRRPYQSGLETKTFTIRSKVASIQASQCKHEKTLNRYLVWQLRSLSQ